MARGSALARVMGFTRSFSSMPEASFERAPPLATHDGFEDMPMEAMAVSAATPEEVDPAPELRVLFPVAEDTDPVPSSTSSGVYQFPAGHAAAWTRKPSPLESETIEGIESGIATLLANMSRGDDMLVDAARPDAPEMDIDDDGDEDAPITALLNELDRLWRDDPEIAAAAVH